MLMHMPLYDLHKKIDHQEDGLFLYSFLMTESSPSAQSPSGVSGKPDPDRASDLDTGTPPLGPGLYLWSLM